VEAQRWFEQRSQDLSDHERKFLSASSAFRERVAQAERRREEHEIETERLANEQMLRAEMSEQRAREQEVTAEKLRRAARRMRRLAIATGGTAVLAGILAAVAMFLYHESVLARTLAEEQELRALREQGVAERAVDQAKQARSEAERAQSQAEQA